MFTLTRTSHEVPDQHDLSLPPLSDGGRGYHHDLATVIGDHFTKQVDHEALANVLQPCSDGTVPAISHAVAARSEFHLVTHAFTNDDDQVTERLEEATTFSGEYTSRTSALVTEGQSVGVEFWNSTIPVSEIRDRVSEDQIGLVSLDWDCIISNDEFTATITTDADSHVLTTASDGTPFFYPVVPIVGYSPEGIIVSTYAHRHLVIPLTLFESARRSPMAEQASVFIADREYERADRTKKVLNRQEILDAFPAIEEQRTNRAELWTRIQNEHADGHEPIDLFMTAAEQMGASHQAIHRLFDFIWVQCEARSPLNLVELAQTFRQAKLDGISGDDFSEFLGDLVTAAEKHKKDKELNVFRAVGDMVERCGIVVGQITTYTGPGKPTLASALRYNLMDLKRIEGPDRSKSTSRVDLALFEVQNPPFIVPDLDNHDPEQFKFINKPRPGEAECVTQVRILLEWLETYGAQQLREALILALGRGSVRIANQEHEILGTPMHNLSEALKRKIGRHVPYHVREICLEHGLDAYRLLESFDAEDAVPEMEDQSSEPHKSLRLWQFAVTGLMQNIREVNRVPSSFTAELEYLGEVLPWMLAGKVHPAYAKRINERFMTNDHRDSDQDGQELRARFVEAKNYLDHLRRAESRLAHDDIWEAFDLISSSDLRERLRPLLTTCLTSRTLEEFTPNWKQLAKALHPDTRTDDDAISTLTNRFFEWGVKRKQELRAKESGD